MESQVEFGSRRNISGALQQNSILLNSGCNWGLVMKRKGATPPKNLVQCKRNVQRLRYPKSVWKDVIDALDARLARAPISDAMLTLKKKDVNNLFSDHLLQNCLHSYFRFLKQVPVYVSCRAVSLRSSGNVLPTTGIHMTFHRLRR